jgi:transcriptional regulator with XRE-family HTH domain
VKVDFNNYKTFGNLLQKLREQKSVSIRGAAVGIGISAVYLCDLEKGGRKPPKGRILNDICSYYNLDEEAKEQLKELIEIERLGTTKQQLELCITCDNLEITIFRHFQGIWYNSTIR